MLEGPHCGRPQSLPGSLAIIDPNDHAESTVGCNRANRLMGLGAYCSNHLTIEGGALLLTKGLSSLQYFPEKLASPDCYLDRADKINGRELRV